VFKLQSGKRKEWWNMPATEIKEKPILFSAPMVRAILEGRKSMTRRVMKPQPEGVTRMAGTWFPPGSAKAKHYATESSFRIGVVRDFCPYPVGTRPWVRETHQILVRDEYDPHDERLDWDTGTGYRVVYLATDEREEFWDESKEDSDAGPLSTAARPSIFMPRWASRIDLEVTAVKVERVQDIGRDNHADVLAEGWPFVPSDAEAQENPVRAFARLWDTIHGPGAWGKNECVWVITFKRVRP
jgi:hypothetical protein